MNNILTIREMKKIIKKVLILLILTNISLVASSQNKNTNRARNYKQEVTPSFVFTSSIFETSTYDSCIEFDLENIRNQNKLDDFLDIAAQYSNSFTVTVVQTNFPHSATLRIKFNDPSNLLVLKRFLIVAEIRNVKKNGSVIDAEELINQQ